MGNIQSKIVFALSVLLVGGLSACASPRPLPNVAAYAAYVDLFDAGKVEDAVAQLRISAASGYGPAEYRYALLFLYGDTVESDLRLAEKWLRRSLLHLNADQANMPQRDLACVLLQKGSASAVREAAILMESASAGSDIRAKIYLSQLYRSGTGVPADAAKADDLLAAALARAYVVRSDLPAAPMLENMQLVRDLQKRPCVPADTVAVERAEEHRRLFLRRWFELYGVNGLRRN